MTSTMMVERTATGLPGVGYPGTGGMPYGTPTAQGASYLMVPRCTLRFEKCQGGLKVHCTSEDRTACGVVQNLCAALAGGLVSCCAQFNGLTVYTCNFVTGLCRCETTEDGVCLSCTSGDAKCGEILQAFCDCLSCLIEAGCTCSVLINNTPVCCGGGEPSKTGSKPKR
ncbi:MAG TPA: hypothetical protein VKA46_42635 [Gemmataceae bacterium]|nr:hypothetical protein [Gemmataceae bacterium]